MQVTVFVPAALRQYAAGERKVRLDLEEPVLLERVFRCLHASYPGVVERALDETWNQRQHVNIFVDGESIRAGSRLGLQTPVRAGAEVWIIPAVSGGEG
jgi:molybdopterin synthase sulfur carrier subunit